MDYYQQKRVSSSSLKHILPEDGGSPKRFNHYMENIGEEQKHSQSLFRGTTIHLYCENPEKFKVDDGIRPSENVCRIVQMIFDNDLPFNDDSLDYCSSQVITTDNKKGLYQNYSKEKRLSALKSSNPEQYYSVLQQSKHHIMLTEKDKNMMDNVVESIHSNEFATGLLFDPEAKKEEAIYWEYTVGNTLVPCKSLLDNVRVNVNKDTIRGRIVDIKTTGKPIYEFIPKYEMIANRIIQTAPSSFLYYKYYRQLAFYLEAVFNSTLHSQPWKRLASDVETFIVCIETSEPYECKVFKVGREWISRGLKEVQTAMEYISHHQTTNEWNKFKHEGQYIEI